jgi:hypothetical protein
MKYLSRVLKFSGVYSHFIFLAALSACGSSGSASSIATSTTIEGSSLDGSITGLRRSGVRGFASVAGLNEAANPCPTGSTTCYSPEAFGGKFRSLNLRIGTDGKYYRLEVISQPQGTDDDGDEPRSDEMRDFDFGAPTAISGSPSLDGVVFNESSNFSDLNWTIGWIDARFPDGTFGKFEGATLRFVYFNDPVTGYQKGDILLKVGEDFKWCPTTADAPEDCSTTRPETPITQNAGIVNYTPGESDPELPYLTAGISADAENEDRVTVSEEELTGGSTISITVDFDHTHAFAIEKDGDTAPTLTNIFDVMPLIYLRGLSATPTDVSVAGGINAILTFSSGN